MIEYGIVCGQLPAGLRLPPVRAMASQLNIAPMTVSQVYKELKDAGLLDTKPGHGTFVSASIPDQVRPAILDLQLRIDQLLHDAAAAGLSGADLVGLVNARMNRRATANKQGLRLVFVGLFEEATKAYGADIQAKLPDGDVISTTTMSEVTSNDLARQRALNADLVLTLANRKADVAEMLPKQRILGINYIPSERTRTLLAQIDPLARVCIVSTFPEFLPIMKAGVQRFAPHVQSIKATVLDVPGSQGNAGGNECRGARHRLRTGVRLLKSGTAHFEYRHTPDPCEIDQVLLPMLESIRGSFPATAEPAPKSEEVP